MTPWNQLRSFLPPLDADTRNQHLRYFRKRIEQCTGLNLSDGDLEASFWMIRDRLTPVAASPSLALENDAWQTVYGAEIACALLFMKEAGIPIEKAISHVLSQCHSITSHLYTSISRMLLVSASDTDIQFVCALLAEFGFSALLAGDSLQNFIRGNRMTGFLNGVVVTLLGHESTCGDATGFQYTFSTIFAWLRIMQLLSMWSEEENMAKLLLDGHPSFHFAFLGSVDTTLCHDLYSTTLRALHSYE